jgi:hypothetical protein
VRLFTRATPCSPSVMCTAWISTYHQIILLFLGRKATIVCDTMYNCMGTGEERKQ